MSDASVRGPALPAPMQRRGPLAIPVLAGSGLLLLRLTILRTPDATRVVLLTIVLMSILVTALLAPVAKEVARVHPAIVAAVGLIGVAVAGFAAGRPIASPLGTAALPLALLAAVSEEALFRRAAFGWLAGAGAIVAVAGSALLFAAIHVPLYGIAAFPIDLGAGLLLSWQRWASGSWAVPAGTHAAANVLAVVLR